MLCGQNEKLVNVMVVYIYPRHHCVLKVYVSFMLGIC
jgi:hypothetical protein